MTGVTTMKIDAGLDTGDILLQEEIPIASDDTAETLAPKLASAGTDLMVRHVAWFGGGNDSTAQAGQLASELCSDSQERRWPD